MAVYLDGDRRWRDTRGNRGSAWLGNMDDACRLFLCRIIMNRTNVCPRNLNTAAAILPGTPLAQAWNPSSLTATRVGQASFAFSGQNNATFTCTVDGVSGMKTISHQIFGVGTSLPAVDYTGLRYNPVEPGWGHSITQPYGTAFVAWYTYDVSGKPLWYVASACAMAADNQSCTGNVYQTTGSFFGDEWDNSKLSVTVPFAHLRNQDQ